ncbi:natural resistance-associated macrophage protein-domain-containing protein [Chaetomium fimeti]|uniref:Natural resistance-associated macrophage protein-domain-containing protein n=1 Tax=Chaetomium fimeti TaxID=1854472 RepID=A0AAE0HBE4_9PEZI|nr:natural resistance-associated macrophage protein-domain-containing protein [Chaetomium fimeti]
MAILGICQSSRLCYRAVPFPPVKCTPEPSPAPVEHRGLPVIGKSSASAAVMGDGAHITPSPTPARDFGLEKKEALDVVDSLPIHREPPRKPWLSILKSWLVLGTESSGRSPVYQNRAPPPPAESDSFWSKIWTFFKFLGPGAIISVAYVDPDNYQTAIASGSSFQYRLLFMVLVSNIIAIYIQSLCIKLGTVTGMDLAQLNHLYLPRWLELFIYVIAEASIIATDLGQVIGQSIALNILIPALPLSAACVISVADTLLILLFYTPTGELRRVRVFEVFVALLVAAVFVTLCVALSMVSPPAGPVFRGFLPSREVFVDTGLYEMCAILGGTLMPHALYVGTALSRSRLYDYDAKQQQQHHHHYHPTTTTAATTTNRPASPTSSSSTLDQDHPPYRPSLRAIRACLRYSIAELCVTLFTVAVFVNSALLIIAGTAFYHPPTNPSSSSSEETPSDDLYTLHHLFQHTISPASATLFAVSLLFSGVSAGVVSTVAGQVVMEGAFSLRLAPFVRRLVTRCVAIIPALAIALAVGRDGLSRALVACNYLLAIALIPITFPLIWYTGGRRYMVVPYVPSPPAFEMYHVPRPVTTAIKGNGQVLTP